MVTRPSTSLTLVFLFAVAAVVMSSDYGSDGAVEAASGSLPADILAANADYERRGREIETGITDASWLASQTVSKPGGRPSFAGSRRMLPSSRSRPSTPVRSINCTRTTA